MNTVPRHLRILWRGNRNATSLPRKVQNGTKWKPGDRIPRLDELCRRSYLIYHQSSIIIHFYVASDSTGARHTDSARHLQPALHQLLTHASRDEG